MARKVVAQNPQRRTGLNRAQLKALAAQQAMANAPARPASTGQATNGGIDLSGVTLPRRRAFLTREQEFAYIRADLIRLVVVAAVLMVILIGTLLILGR